MLGYLSFVLFGFASLHFVCCFSCLVLCECLCPCLISGRLCTHSHAHRDKEKITSQEIIYCLTFVIRKHLTSLNHSIKRSFDFKSTDSFLFFLKNKTYSTKNKIKKEYKSIYREICHSFQAIH